MRRIGAVILYCLVLGISAAQAQHGEYAVKAAFLYNFAKFAEWPETAFATTDGSFVIFILGLIPLSLLRRASNTIPRGLPRGS